MKKLKQLIKKYKLKAKILIGYTYKGHRKEPIVFILSTGRCGSTSIKDIFNQHPKFIAFHEDMKPLIRLSTELAEHPERQKDIYKELDTLFANRLWEAKKGQIIVHSDHRLWNLVPYLSNYFSNAYFIHLIRNPYDSVKSFLQRDWYNTDGIIEKQNLFDKYRLHGDRVKDVTKEQWRFWDQTEKCIWYWNFVNSSIHYQLNQLTGEKSNIIRLEEFIEAINEIIPLRFGLEESFKFNSVHLNKSLGRIEDNYQLLEIKTKIEKIRSNFIMKYYSNL